MSPMPSGDGKNFFGDLMMGGVAGGISKTVGAPLERVKLILQLQSSSTQIAEADKYKGMIDCCKRVYKEQGFLSFWRGNMANVLRYFPTQACNFAFKEKYRKIFVRHDPKENFPLFFVGNVLSGGAAGATSLSFVYPLDFVRTRLGADLGATKEGRQFNGTWDCLSKIYKQDGVKGLYQGFLVSLAGIIVYRAAFFGIYDSGKALLYDDYSKTNPFLSFGLGMTAETGAGIIAYPFDTVRRRMMMQAGRAEVQYSSTIDCWKKIASQEGMAAYFKGCFSNILRGTSGAMVPVIFDEFKKIQVNLNKKKSLSA